MGIPSNDLNRICTLSEQRLSGNEEASHRESKTEKEETKEPSFISRCLTYPTLGIVWYFGLKLVRGVRIINPATPLAPQTYVLAFTIKGATIETASAVNALALGVLGERSTYANLDDLSRATMLCHLRHKSWKMISLCEGVTRKVDSIYSRVFDIRTEEEIAKAFSDDQSYYRDGDPRVMEIARRAFFDMVRLVFRRGVPFYLGFQGAAFLGYPNHVPMFFLNKIPLEIIFTFTQGFFGAYREIQREEVVRDLNYLEGLSLLETRRDTYLKGSDDDGPQVVQLKGLESYPGLVLANCDELEFPTE